MSISYSTELEEMAYSKDKRALLRACDRVVPKIKGIDISTSLEYRYPRQNVVWFSWHGNPNHIAIAFMGTEAAIMKRFRKIPDRSESDTVDNHTT